MCCNTVSGHNAGAVAFAKLRVWSVSVAMFMNRTHLHVIVAAVKQASVLSHDLISFPLLLWIQQVWG